MKTPHAAAVRLKISGKRIEIPTNSVESLAHWSWELRPGDVWIATHQSTGERVRLYGAGSTAPGGEFSFSVGGKLGLARREMPVRRGAAAGAGDGADLVAQFPGKVRKVLVAAGAQVQEGDPLLLVEAMKMEFAIKAPSAGKVTQVLVADGQQLTPGTRFLDFVADQGDK